MASEELLKKRKIRRKLRREGKTLSYRDVGSLKDIVEKNPVRQRKVVELLRTFDQNKISEWELFLASFEVLWRGAVFLPKEESEMLDNLQREVSKASKLFGPLSKELEQEILDV